MHIIEQKLVVRDWPLQKPGDELFFGYVVAVGVFPQGGSDDDLFAYADFAYNDGYTRYRLPNDEGLRNGLLEHLYCNIEMNEAGDGIYGKLWVRRTAKGHEVDTP